MDHQYESSETGDEENHDALSDEDETEELMLADAYHFFWRQGPFSQWRQSKYTLHGFTYSSAEQGMMHSKALLFHDFETASRILSSKNPKEIKQLGRQVRHFKDSTWRHSREEIVYEHNVAKYTQNPALRRALLQTQGELVEASPSDRIWGIGLRESEAKRTPPNQWPGLSLLGQILTQIRDEIRNGVHDSLLVVADGEEQSTKHSVEDSSSGQTCESKKQSADARELSKKEIRRQKKAEKNRQAALLAKKKQEAATP